VKHPVNQNVLSASLTARGKSDHCTNGIFTESNFTGSRVKCVGHLQASSCCLHVDEKHHISTQMLVRTNAGSYGEIKQHVAQ
jgi:hypothetical protein